MDKKEFYGIMEQLDRINNQFTAVRRTKSFSGEGITYHPAEIQILNLISDKPMITVSDAADSLFITRSAASQIIKKMAAKKLIHKKRNLMNERIINLSLTQEGEDVISRFRMKEAAAMEEFYNSFSEIPEEDMRIARGFLYKLESVLKVKMAESDNSKS